MSRWGWAVIAGVFVVVASAAAAWLVSFRDSSTPVSVANMVSTYRGTTAPGRPGAGAAGRLPSPGVYVFRTKGAESIDDTPLGGAEHVYPATTGVIVDRDGCGFVEQWMPLEGRSRAVVLCRTPRGWTMTRATDTRTFFDIEVPRDFACPGGALQTPFGTGRTWRSTCPATGFSKFAETARSRLVGREALMVGDRRVTAVHVREDVRLTGETRGRAGRDTWRRAADGLLLRLQYREESVMASHVGDVRFSDRYELTLTSLMPRR